MRKGIIFSLDSMFAVLLLVIIAAAYANVADNNNTQLKIAGLRTDEAIDGVLMGNYSGNISDKLPAGINLSCVEWWDYEITPGSGQTSPVKKIICEGFS
jgi:hypothetical protein